MRGLVGWIIACMLVTVVAACGDDDQRSYVANVTDPMLTPTMATRKISTLISDSGYTRYHITTPLWLMYDDLADPFWRFPDGLDLEQYDDAMRPAANMRCDSARYFSNRRLWRLDGNVVMVNSLRDSFLTQQLFWDQARAEVYSDSFIHIVRQQHIIEGYGFTSNQQMTAYDVKRPTAIIPIQKAESRESRAESDSIRQLRGERPVAPPSASQRAAASADYTAAPAQTTLAPTSQTMPVKRPD